jgi:hypothetical protein
MIDELRQISETYFKYHHGLVQIQERLSFLTVQKTVHPLAYLSSAKRTWYSPISITDEINQLFYLKKQNQK